jgi:Protein of unknown function (DUF1059)
MEVTCRCGWTTRGSKSEVIASIQAHGKAEHGLDVTPDEVRAVWRVLKDDGGPGRRSGGRQ